MKQVRVKKKQVLSKKWEGEEQWKGRGKESENEEEEGEEGGSEIIPLIRREKRAKERGDGPRVGGGMTTSENFGDTNIVRPLEIEKRLHVCPPHIKVAHSKVRHEIAAVWPNNVDELGIQWS